MKTFWHVNIQNVTPGYGRYRFTDFMPNQTTHYGILITHNIRGLHIDWHKIVRLHLTSIDILQTPLLVRPCQKAS